jgi:hypothetical protein|tara:strand:- start:2485 stop:2640 length:156 start_codon:yes stop_codon:yes gene_type:complete
MTQRMMRLFNTIDEAYEHIKSDQGISLKEAKVYVDQSIAQRIDEKVWVVLP